MTLIELKRVTEYMIESIRGHRYYSNNRIDAEVLAVHAAEKFNLYIPDEDGEASEYECDEVWQMACVICHRVEMSGVVPRIGQAMMIWMEKYGKRGSPRGVPRGGGL